MKRGFIRGLWGIMDAEHEHRTIRRRIRMSKEIRQVQDNKFTEPFRTYVMGKENYEELVSFGVDSVLITEEKYMFDLIKNTYRNKMEILRYAMEEDGYDQIVYLDWDCTPTRKLPSDFWDILEKKEPFQACLQMYRRKKCRWRKIDKRRVPNGGFLYIADKEIPKVGIKLWEELGSGYNDEPAWAKMTDDMVGGWQGVEKYYELFEPELCNLHKNTGHGYDPRIPAKDICFIHRQGL